MSVNGNGRTTAPPPASAVRGHRAPAPAPPIAQQRTGGSVANPPTHRAPHQSQQHHHDARDAHSDDSRYDEEEEEDGESDYENSAYGDEGGSDEEGSEYDDEDEYDGGTDAEAEPVGDDEQDEVIHADADYDSGTQLGKNCTNVLLCQWLAQSVEGSKLAPQQKDLCAQRIVLRNHLLDYMRVNRVTRARRLFTDGKYVEVRIGNPRASSSTANGIIEKAIREHVKPTRANDCAAEVENRAEKQAKEEAKRAKKEAERALHQHALLHDDDDGDDDGIDLDDDNGDGKDRPAKRPRTSPSDTLPSDILSPVGGIVCNSAPTAQSKRGEQKGPSLSDTVAELIVCATRSVQEARSAARGRPSLKVIKYDKAAGAEPIVIGKEDADLAMNLPGIPGGAQAAPPAVDANVGDGKVVSPMGGDPVLDAIAMAMAARGEREKASPTSAPSVHRLSVTAARWARDFYALGEKIADLNKELRPRRAHMAALTLDLAPLPEVAVEGSRAPTKAAVDKRALHAHYTGLRDVVAKHIGAHPSNERGGVPWHVPPEISPAHGDYRIGVVTKVRRGTLTRARYLTLVQHAAAAVLSDSGFEATRPYSYDATGEIFATWDLRERLGAAIKAAIAQHREHGTTKIRALVISKARDCP